MAGLKEDIELDVSAALKDVDKLEAALGQTVKTFKVELAKATEQLRGPDGRFVAKVKVDDGGSIKRAARDLDSVEDEARQAEVATKKLSGSFDGVRTAAAGALSALGTRVVVDEIGRMVNAASDLAESQSKVSVVFGESTPVIEQWGETSAEAVGLAKQEAFEAAGTFGNLFTALGLSQEAAAKLSPEVVGLGADLASFNNLDVPETLEKLRSGLVGEIEPLRSLGISFGAAEVEAKAMSLGLADANGELTEGAKVQARWALITEQSTAAAGDFARTSDGLANQQRILKAEIGNARAEIGERLLPLMLDAVKFGRGFLDFFLSLPEPVQNATLMFVGLGISLGPVLLAVGNITRAVSGVSGAITGLSKLLGTSTALVSGWAAALVAVGAVVVAFSRYQQARADYQRAINDGVAEEVNQLALLQSEGAGANRMLKEQGVAAFLASGGMKGLAEESETAGIALEIAKDNLEAIEEQTPKAAATLDALSKSTGVAKERIVQLATSMGVNLGSATEEQTEKLGAAIAQISAATTPAQRLAQASEVLGNEFATTTEEIDAFNEALEAALGVYLSSEQATIRVRQRVDELALAFKEGRKEGETLQQFQDRLTLATHDVTDAVLREVQALVEDGTVSGEAAVQKKAIIDRLLALADTMGGPMAKELREHAMRVANIPDEAITLVKADTSNATNALSGLRAMAKVLGQEVANEFAAGIVAGFRDPANQGRITASADSIAATIETAANRRLGIRSPSTVGKNVGLEFVNGIVLGLRQQEVLAYNEAFAFAHGLEDVWREAASITAEESLRIFAAQDAVREAQARLNWIRADARSTAEQLHRAEVELARSQELLNEAVFEGRDASEELTAAFEEQRREAERLNDSLDSALGAYDALNGVSGAQRSLRRAEQELHQLRSRESVLPGEIARAEADLAAARREGTQVTAREALAVERARQRMVEAETKLTEARADSATTQDELTVLTLEATVASEDYREEQAKAVASTGNVETAERRLADLRREQVEIVEQIRDATERVTDAQFALVDAQRRLIEAGSDLVGSEDEMVAFFEAIARQAGLSEDAIDSMVDAIRRAIDAAEDAANAPPPQPGGGGGGGGTPPNSQFPYGPPGTVVTRNGTRYIVDYDGQLTRADAYVPQVQAITPRSMAKPVTKPAAVGGKSTTVIVQPKTAVYDEKQTAGTMRVVELLS